MEAERFLLKWNNHQSNLVSVFDQLYEQEAFTDVTLACDGRTFAAHKVILSACSPYFQALFLGNPCKHPIIFMKDVRAGDMEALLSFMYRGEINVHQQDLASFLKTAECLHIKGLSDSSERHKDTSKILEAMERKFCNPLMQHAFSSPSSTPTSTSTMAAAMGGGGTPSLGTPAIGTPSVPTVSSSESPTPPNKKFKSMEGLPRILPKMKPLTTPPGLVTPVPGLLTPITLAATVIKNAAHAAHIAQNAHISPPTPDTANSSPNTETSTPTKDVKKEGYISGDSPHPVYLVSSVGGVGATGTISSGNSTPSHEVKVEEEDPLDESSFTDDQAYSASMKHEEEPMVHSGGGPPTPFIDETAIKKEDDLVSDIDITYFGTLNSDLNCSSNSFDDIPQDLSLNSQRIHMESLFKCSLDNVISPEPEVPGTMITPLSEADHYLNCKQEYENPGREYSKLLLEQSLENISPFISATEKVEDIDSQQNSVDDCLPGPTFSPGVLRALPFSEPAWAALEKITAYSRDIRKDPEAIKQLIKKVKDYLKLRQQRMEGKDTEDELFGHTDHTYVTQRKTNVIHHYKCSQCGKLFPKNCRHRFLSHMRTHTGERPFKCNVCGRGFSRQDHVQVHMRLHTGEKPFKCTSCDASYAHKVSLKSHKCEQYRAKQRKEMEQTQEDTHQMQNENNVKVTESEKSLVTSTDILGCHGKSMDTLCNKPNSSNLESRNYTDIKTDGVERPMPKLVPV